MPNTAKLVVLAMILLMKAMLMEPATMDSQHYFTTGMTPKVQ